MADSVDTALGHLHVLELGGALAAYTGHHLAELGADVVKIEPPQGAPERFEPPFAGDIPGAERSVSFAYFNANKRSAVLDLTTAAGREDFRRLAMGADIVVESYAPGYLSGLGIGYEQLRAQNPGLVFVSVTPFGQWGPHSGFRGIGATAEAASGMIFTLGDNMQSPCISPNDLLAQMTGTDAAYAALAGVYCRRRRGAGQHIDISAQEVGTHVTAGIAEYGANKNIRRRAGAGSLGGATNVYELKGGPVHFMPGYIPHWKILVNWMNDPVLSSPEWESNQYRQANADVIAHLVREFVGQYTAEQLVSESQTRGIPCGPVNTVQQAVESPQFEALGAWQARTHPVVGPHKTLKLVDMTETPIVFQRPAPALGAHTQEALAEAKARTKAPAPLAGGSNGHSARRGPLAGLRILDFTRVVAGPTGTQILSYLGAEVIKIESSLLPSLGRETGMAFPDLNRAKKSVTIDTRTPRGRALALELAAKSDVVIDNFSAHIMKKLGLDYASLRKVKSDIIAVSLPGMGRTGPLSEWGTFGQTLQSYTGMVDLWRHPETKLDAGLKTPIADYVCAEQLALAVMASIEYRDRTGKGQFIDLAQVAGLSHTMGAQYMDYMVNGRIPRAKGYQSNHYAPFGAYPCRGDDAWCVIAVETDGEWAAFRRVLGEPGWVSDEKFSTRAARIQNRAELDQRIGQWTRGYTKQQVMYFCQNEGVIAAPINNAEDVYHDMHLRLRGHIVKVDHPEPYGTFEHQGLPFRFSDTPGNAAVPCPREGEHNEEVFLGLLGMSRAELQQNIAEKVVH